MAGIPRFNLAAFLMPPIWGPAHGNWVTILYYPLWVFVDNCIYSAYTMRTAGTIAIAVVMVLSLAAATWMFAMVAGPMAAHRAAERGISKETYVRRQKIWAVVCIVIAVLMLGFATYYNLALRGAAA
ncbi:MAG: viscotoxin-A3 [Eggerthellaceae bacterium]|nr:viscotoxin-A3 [Eggerthellaceae bacterium]